jgi:hypothetical protein
MFGRQPKKEEDMAIRLTVRRGDSLWGLACRYLGSGERYRQIFDFHNQEAARYGLRPIERPDLIFVGQTILIPPRPKWPKSGNGTKTEGGQWPIPLSLKVTYAIGRDTPPIIYEASYGDYTIKTEMSGEIGIENKTPGHSKYVLNYELAMSKDPAQVKQKLRNAYDPAFVALTANPEMVFESGTVKIKAPIAANANLGSYAVKVSAETPMHYSGTIKPQTVSGTLELGRSRYKYSADIELKVDVIWHTKPKGEPVTVKAIEPVQKVEHLEKPAAHPSKWDRTVAEKGVVVAVVVLVLYATSRALALFATKGALRPIIMPPMIHKIDHYNSREGA